MMSTQLLDMWSTWNPNEQASEAAPRLFLKDDRAAVIAADKNGKVVPAGHSWTDVISDEKFGVDDRRLHLSLMPVPFLGNVREAKVIVLMQNPGLSPCDYYAEFRVDGFRDRLVENLKGYGCAGDFPFLFLDPANSWHSGFTWWNRKLRPVIEAVAAELRLGDDLRTARMHVANHLGAVELLPYHSRSGVLSHAELEHFSSVRWARDFVHHQILQCCTKVVVARHAAAWGLKKLVDTFPHCVVYEAKDARAASLNPESETGRKGGRLIVDAIVRAVRDDRGGLLLRVGPGVASQ